ncbi:hypothetical protein D3C78_1784240 [compost metagenome]
MDDVDTGTCIDFIGLRQQQRREQRGRKQGRHEGQGGNRDANQVLGALGERRQQHGKRIREAGLWYGSAICGRRGGESGITD